MADGGKVIIKIDGDNNGFKNAMGGIGKISGAAFKGIAIGAGAAATAIGAIGTAAVKSYAEYEQLVGGVETLFKDSAKILENYANEAYKTAGMSANEYMSTVTSFSASLLKSLGGDTKKAAEYGNQAVIDMSDNANKMGTSIEMIQNAYQGFAKQNYTMLDNLKLGYGGTKTEMEKLLKDAEKISGIKFNIDSFADVTQAIHVIQTEMGITGTTSREAATTIEGSFNMLKASWDNLMVGLADPTQNLDVLIDNVINSAMALLENVGPVIESVLNSLPTAISVLGTKLLQELPGVVSKILPVLADTATQLIDTFSQALTDNAELLGTTALTIVMTLVNCLLDNLPLLLDTALTQIITLAEGLTQALPQLIPSVTLIILKIVEILTDNIDLLVDVSIELIMALADGIIAALPILIEKAPEIIIKFQMAIYKNMGKLLQAGIDLVLKLLEGIVNTAVTLYEKVSSLVHENIIQPVIDKASEMINVGKDLIEGLWNGIKEKAEDLKKKVQGVVDSIKKIFTGVTGFKIKSPSKWSEQVFAYVMDGGVNGLEKRKNKLLNKVAEIVKDTRSEVQKIEDSYNEMMLDSEKYYLEEKERIEREKEESEYQEKLKNAKDSEEQEKIKQERLRKIAEEEQEKYLETLKDAADKERAIYEALQKDIEDSKNQIIDNFTQMTESAFDSIKELENIQKSYENKLKNYGSLYRTYELPTITLKNGEQITPEKTELADLKKQNQVLKDYANALQAVKKKGNVPKEFFTILRDMSVEEGSKFAKTLLDASQEDFDAYIEDWKTNQKLAEDLSKEMFADEAKDLKTEIISTFDMAASEFFEAGENSAEQFGEGFIKELKTMFATVSAELNYYLGSITSSVAIAGMETGTAFSTSNSYSPTYNIYGPYDQSTREQIKAENTKTKLQWLRGGYKS